MPSSSSRPAAVAANGYRQIGFRGGGLPPVDPMPIPPTGPKRKASEDAESGTEKRLHQDSGDEADRPQRPAAAAAAAAAAAGAGSDSPSAGLIMTPNSSIGRLLPDSPVAAPPSLSAAGSSPSRLNLPSAATLAAEMATMEAGIAVARALAVSAIEASARDQKNSEDERKQRLLDGIFDAYPDPDLDLELHRVLARASAPASAAASVASITPPRTPLPSLPSPQFGAAAAPAGSNPSPAAVSAAAVAPAGSLDAKHGGGGVPQTPFNPRTPLMVQSVFDAGDDGLGLPAPAASSAAAAAAAPAAAPAAAAPAAAVTMAGTGIASVMAVAQLVAQNTRTIIQTQNMQKMARALYKPKFTGQFGMDCIVHDIEFKPDTVLPLITVPPSAPIIINASEFTRSAVSTNGQHIQLDHHQLMRSIIANPFMTAVLGAFPSGDIRVPNKMVILRGSGSHPVWNNADTHISDLYVLAVGSATEVIVNGAPFSVPPRQISRIAIDPPTPQARTAQSITATSGAEVDSWVQIAFHDPSANSAYHVPVIGQIVKAAVSMNAAADAFPSAFSPGVIELPTQPSQRTLIVPPDEHLPILKAVTTDSKLWRRQGHVKQPFITPTVENTKANWPEHPPYLTVYVDSFVPRSNLNAANVRGPSDQQKAVFAYVKKQGKNQQVVYLPRIKNDITSYVYTQFRPDDAPFVKDPDHFYSKESVHAWEFFKGVNMLTDASWRMFASKLPDMSKRPLSDDWLQRSQTGFVIALSGGSLDEVPFFDPRSASYPLSRRLEKNLSADSKASAALAFPDDAFQEWLKLNPAWRRYAENGINPFDLINHPLTAVAGVPSLWLHQSGQYGRASSALVAAYVSIFIEAALEIINTPAPGLQKPDAELNVKEGAQVRKRKIEDIALEKARRFAHDLCKWPLIGKVHPSAAHAQLKYPSMVHALKDLQLKDNGSVRYDGVGFLDAWMRANRVLEQHIVSIVIDLTRRIRRIVHLPEADAKRPAAVAASAAAAGAGAGADPMTGGRNGNKRGLDEGSNGASTSAADAADAAAAAAAEQPGSKRQRVSKTPTSLPASMFVTNTGTRRLAPVFYVSAYSRLIIDMLGWTDYMSETKDSDDVEVGARVLRYQPTGEAKDAKEIPFSITTTVPFLEPTKAAMWSQPVSEPIPAIMFEFDTLNLTAINLRVQGILAFLSALQAVFGATSAPPALGATVAQAVRVQPLSSFSSLDVKALQLLPSYKGLSLPDCAEKFRDMERLQAAELKHISGAGAAAVAVTGGGAMRCAPLLRQSDIDWDSWVRCTPARRVHVVLARYHATAIAGFMVKHPIRGRTAIDTAHAAGAIGNHKALTILASLQFSTSAKERIHITNKLEEVKTRRPTGVKRKFDDASMQSGDQSASTAAAAAAAAAALSTDDDGGQGSGSSSPAAAAAAAEAAPFMTDEDYKSAVLDENAPQPFWQMFYMPKDAWIEFEDPRKSITDAQKALWATDAYEQGQNDPRLMMMAPVHNAPDQSEFASAMKAFLLRASDDQTRVALMAPVVVAYRTSTSETKDGVVESEWMMMLYSGTMEPRVPTDTVTRFKLDRGSELTPGVITRHITASLTELITLSNTRVDMKSTPLEPPVFAYSYITGGGAVPTSVAVRPYVQPGVRVEDMKLSAIADAVADEFFHSHSLSGKPPGWIAATYMAVYVRSRIPGQMNCAGLYRGHIPAVAGDPWYRSLGDTPTAVDDDDGNVVFEWQEQFPILIQNDIAEREVEGAAALRQAHAKRQRMNGDANAAAAAVVAAAAAPAASAAAAAATK